MQSCWPSEGSWLCRWLTRVSPRWGGTSAVLCSSNYRLNESLALDQVGGGASWEGPASQGSYITFYFALTHPAHTLTRAVSGGCSGVQGNTGSRWLLLEPGYIPYDLPCQDNAQRTPFILNRVYRKSNPGPPSSYPQVDGLANRGEPGGQREQGNIEFGGG